MKELEPLCSVVYLSVATESDQQLVDLLAVSRSNNERLNITGMLLYHNGVFLQALEGPKNVVAGYSEFLNDATGRPDFIRWPHKALGFLLSFRDNLSIA